MANSTGPKYPTAAADGGFGSGGPWTSLTNAYASDNAYVSGDISGGGYISSQLKTTGYGFSIPSTAVIVGVQVDVERNGSFAQDFGAQLIKGGTVAGVSRSSALPGIGGSDTIGSFGGPTDMWGLTLTPSDVNASNFGAMYQAQNTHGGGGVFVDTVGITVFWQTAPADVPKRYLYKVYTAAGSFLGVLPNVFSEFTFSQEINTGGSQILIQCGISADTSRLPSGGQILDETGAAILDETTDPLLSEAAVAPLGLGAGSSALIKNGNLVVVWEYGYYYPNGRVCFRGEMERWEASFGGDAEDNSINIMVYSDGADLDNYLLLGSPFTYTTDQSQVTQNASTSVTEDSRLGYNRDGQSFTVGAGVTNVGGIYLLLNGTANVTVTLYDGVAMSNVLAAVTQAVSVGTATEILFGFAAHAIVVPASVLFFTVQVDSGQSITLYYSTSNPYSGGSMYQASYAGGGGGGGYGISTGWDLYFKTASSNGSTTATFTSLDPSTGILKAFIDDYHSRGGQINYASGTLVATGLSLTYQFNTNTIYEGIQAMLSVSPAGFFYYVDVATDTLYFKKASTSADILLTKGVHINKLTMIATIENISNLVYFVGAETSGVNLYKAYQNGPSIALYGQRLDRRSDNRVTSTATADAIGTSAIAEEKDEQYQTVVTVLDKTMDTSLIKPGMVVGFRGFGTFVDTVIAQIVRIDYTPEAVTLTLGLLPPRLGDDVESVTRGLIADQTINNPSAPS